MSDKEFPGSTQKELLAGGASPVSKYRTLFIGRRGLWPLLKYEFITLLVLPLPGAVGLFLRKVFLPWILGGMGHGVVVGRNVTLRHPHKIFIGDRTVIDDNVVLDAKGEANRGLRIGANVYIGRNSILTCKEGSITVGDFCNISANCSLLSETDITLGAYCFLAGECYLVAGGNHPIRDVSRPIMFQPSTVKGGIRLDDDVWLGAGVIVLDGVTAGKGSVVGAGAILSASLPEYSYVVPDRRLRILDRRAL